MKQPWWLLFVGFLAASCMSLKLVQCSRSTNEIHNTSCYNTSSKRTCFTTFFTNLHLPMRRSFENASDWCKAKVPRSSLIVIKSAEDQHNVESFIGRQALENETIIMDARKLTTVESQKWSWVNGYQTIPNVALAGDNRGTVVALTFQQNLSVYILLDVLSSSRYICEFSDSESAYDYKQDNNCYVSSNKTATWYNARKECLSLGGDLASITDLRMINDWSWLNTNYGYFIGLHRNKWIWNRPGAAITYTNWEGGYPVDSSDKQCICISRQCSGKSIQTICGYDMKWSTCNCNHNYAIVCQKHSDVSRTEIVVPEGMLTSKSADYTTTIADNTIGEIDRKTASSNHFDENQTPALASSSTGLFNTTEILLVILFLVAVAFIVAAVIVIIRKRRYNRRNERTYMNNTAHSEAVSSLYTTVVPDNYRPSEGIVPSGNSIYAEVEMTQQPTASNNTIYASVQPTCEAVDMGKSVVYAEVNIPHKDQQTSRSADKKTACLNHVYSEPYELATSASYTEYAEPHNPDK